VAVLGLLFSREIPREERLLAQLHGAAFADYAARTPALWPRRPAAVTPVTEIQLRPELFRKAFLDAGAMLMLLAFVVLFAALRQSGSLPTLLPLP
jgi:hypothetical protein